MANLIVTPQVQPANIDATSRSSGSDANSASSIDQKDFQKKLGTDLEKQGQEEVAALQAGLLNAVQNPQIKENRPSGLEEKLPTDKKEGKKIDKNAAALTLMQQEFKDQVAQKGVQKFQAKPVDPKMLQQQMMNTKTGDAQKQVLPEDFQAQAAAAAGVMKNGKVQAASTGERTDEIQVPHHAELKVSGVEFKGAEQALPNSSRAQQMKNAPVTANDPIAAVPPKSQGPSTDDYLALRDSLKKQKPELSMRSELPTAAPVAHHLTAHHAMPVVDAQTTENGKSKMILSHDAIDRLTNQVTSMSKMKQDGEIRIRLRPDHLGELQMSVKSQGQNVSVQIRAASGEAKRIIEASLHTLKESLGAQSLNLSKVEVVTAPNASQAMNSDSFNPMDSSGQRQHSFEQQQNAREERFVEEMPESFRKVNVTQIPARARVSSGTQGLDLIA